MENNNEYEEYEIEEIKEAKKYEGEEDDELINFFPFLEKIFLKI
jgi:hypothetical protein